MRVVGRGRLGSREPRALLLASQVPFGRPGGRLMGRSQGRGTGVCQPWAGGVRLRSNWPNRALQTKACLGVIGACALELSLTKDRLGVAPGPAQSVVPASLQPAPLRLHGRVNRPSPSKYVY